MKLLDLFCGAGGAAMGYSRAGFDEIVGVDNRPQKNYPFEFVQADALEYLAEHGDEFDLIHASPPCQAYVNFNFTNNKKNQRPTWDSVPPTREILQSIGRPFIIENVPTSPLLNWVMLCGSSFGLMVRRHRRFEASMLFLTPPCVHNGPPPIGVYGDHPQSPGDQKLRINRAKTLDEAQRAMGISWMSWKELTQAIPPAYTEYIGRALLNQISVVKV